jgi:hypothetical protein
LTAQIAGAAALVIAFTATASAQGASNFLNSADPLFTSVLARPGNLDNTIAYAASAAAQGDIESAISAYEQLRFYNPRLGATRYQLGVLYYQLGSYAQARGYLQTALQMPDVTPELRQKIEDLLDLVDKKLQPDQFSGFAQTGLRYQTNASLGAGSQTVLASGGTLNNNFVAKSDWNWFGTVGLDYVHDFETQTGETFEASVIAYDAQQFSLHQFDIGLVELRAGPRFALAPGDINGLTVKPYVIATGATLADAAYMGGIGGGLTLHATVGRIALDPYVEVVRQSFRNSSFYPLASGLKGTHRRRAGVRPDRFRDRLAIAHRLCARQRPVRFRQLQKLCRRRLAAIGVLLADALGRQFAVDDHSDRRRDNLELRRARPVRCAVYHRAYNRMAGRAWRRSADLAETRIRIAAAISQRDIECSGVLLSRPGDQRRTVDQILRAQ